MKIVSILMKIVMHITQGIIGAVSVFSVIGLVYFTLMSTLENRYQYAIVAGICLALSAFFTISVIFQVASLLAALSHPGHIVIYAPEDSFPCRRDAS
ncbi:hypothetical protein C5472_06555 [Photorhabdus sp. RW14-46]|nr:hypothetical protein [Photorhabdus sp. RW14-46]